MKQKKSARSLSALLASTLFIGGICPAAQAAEVHVSVDSAAFSGTVRVQENTTYVPLRQFFTFLGWDVSWDAAAACAQVAQNDTVLTIFPWQQQIKVQKQTLDIPLFVAQEQIYLPLRTLCALVGYRVQWDRHTRTAHVATQPSHNWNTEDITWLARIIYAEAGAEPFTGQVAVGNVVCNRVTSADFPNNIYDVIFDTQDGIQFEPVSLGTIENTPSDAAFLAAELALQGVNVVGDSLFFFNPALSEGTWVRSNRSYYTTIGGHQFYL